MHPTLILDALSKGEPSRELFWVKENCWKCSVLLPLIRIPRVNTEHGQFAIHIISIKRGPRNNYNYVKKNWEIYSRIAPKNIECSFGFDCFTDFTTPC